MLRLKAVLAVALVGSVGAGACSSSTSVDGNGGGAAGAGSNTASLPCGVATVVEQHCLVCHGSPLRAGAPQPLLTVANWQAPSLSDPVSSVGALSVARMNNTTNPMPPAGMITADEIAVVADWVANGMPGGDCDPMSPDDPLLDAPPGCTSMDLWPAPMHRAPGKQEEEMFPGMPCIDCHQNPAQYGQNESGPIFDLAGTVFPTGHEPDLCAGLDGAALTDVLVHIQDANGTVWDLHPNASGNFYLFNSGLVPPYSASVMNADGVRAMSHKPTTGDCNLCHTQNGSSGPDPNGPVAPGRIVVPSPQP